MTNDPFGGNDGEKTVFKPNPGGGRPRPGGGGTPPPAPPAGPPPGGNVVQTSEFTAGGDNGLVASAAPLFALAGQLANTPAHNDVGGLITHVAQEVQNFEASARNRGEDPGAILAGRYAICTLIDEVVLSTPWGAQSAWGSQTLLVKFHNEAWGGEKFFQIVQRAMQDPSANLNLLEFLYICLSLGLGGKYRVQQNGAQQLQQVRDSVYAAIRQQRGDYERQLSPHWEGVKDQRPKLALYVPLWAVAAGIGLILALIYTGFLYSLNGNSDPVVSELASLGRNVEPIEERALPVSTPRLRLAEILSGDQQDGLLEVQDLPGRSVVSLWELFPSGQAQVAGDKEAVLERVAEALNQFPGRITVKGHTDNIPVRTLRFPSNWELSESRAQAVGAIVSSVVDPGRVNEEGSGDSEPLVPNDTPANRAKNRRVEITLFAQSQDY